MKQNSTKKNIGRNRLIWYLLPLLTPIFVFAQPAPQTEFGRLIKTVLGIMNQLGILIVSLALVLFLWGLTKFIISDSPEKRKNAKNFIINGIIILLVMTSLWGLVYVFRYTLRLPERGTPHVDTSENINTFR